MDSSPVRFDTSALIQKLEQAYRSLPELDLVIFSVLKQIKNGVKGESISIWLLNELKTELECSHAVGKNASYMIGSLMGARKFVSTLIDLVKRQANFDNLHYSKWMDAKIYQDFFRSDANKVIVTYLVARTEIIGACIISCGIGKTAFTNEERDLVNTLSSHLAVAIQNTQLYEKQHKTGERQKLFDQISLHLHQTLDIDELIPRIFAEVNKAIKAEAQSIWLVDDEAGAIKCRYTTGAKSEKLKGFSMPLSTRSIVGTSVSKKKSIIIKNAQNDPRRARSADEMTGFVTRTLMTVPLVLDDKAIGAIQAVNKRGRELFTQDDLGLFRSIADSAALAVNNAQLVADLQNSYDLTLEALSAALDLRDRETEGHSRRVVEYTSRLAEQIGLAKERIKSIRRGALIHDIGKIGVPDAVLNKPGSLTAKERKIINRHPEAGYSMLAGIPYLREEIEIVICHQEKWDGSGYPFGLRGEEISIGARLFAIADTFDALTSNRPYRRGRSVESARKIIQKESGKQFDPRAVEAFLAVPVEEWIEIREQVMQKIVQRQSLNK